MTFQKGDRVKFLNDVGGGIITRVDNKTIYVENEDGFEVPVAASQLLLEAPYAEPTPFTAAATRPVQPVAVPEKIVAPQVEDVSAYIDLSSDPDESNLDATVSILLGWVHQPKKTGETAFDLYLVNNCSYDTMYVSAMVRNGAYRGIQAGMLENDTTIHLAQISGEEFKQTGSIRLEILFFKKGAFVPQEPMRYELKIDEFYLTDPVNYVSNPYFDEKALIYNVSDEYLMAEIENAAQETLKQSEKQKMQADCPPIPEKKAADADTEEVDLHIEQLLDNPKAFTPAEMLNIQMEHFRGALEEAIHNRLKRIVFIHGVGNGRLRLEIQRLLDQKYPKLRYQDASFKEYGYGATMVILRR
jgi:hypothetical protein